MIRTNRWGLRVIELLAPAVLVGLWWALSAHSKSPYFLPLKQIVSGFTQSWTKSTLSSDVYPSVLQFAIGFTIASVLGIGLGVALGLSPRVRRDVSPLTEFGRAIPIAALVPVALVTIGPGPAMAIFLVIFGCVWPILIASCDGVRGVDRLLLETAHIYGLSPTQRIWRVVLPAALPQIAAGVRIAIGVGMAAMVLSTVFGASQGLGFFIVQAQQDFNVIGTWEGLLMIGLIGIVANGLFLIAQHRLLAWHRGWRGTTEAA